MSQLDDTPVPKQMTGVEDEQSNSEATDETNKKKFEMKWPPRDWHYRVLLKKIAQEMNTNDVKIAKLLFKGELERELSETNDDAFSLFDILGKKGFLDSNNILYLQSLLLHADRQDLFNMVAEFSDETLKDVVYFRKPRDEPAPGYGFVKLHIIGQNFDDFTRSSLEELRSIAAIITGLLPKDIIISGIELCKSVWVTMMLSLEHIDSLERALMESGCKNDLASIGVNKVGIGDKTWDIEGCEAEQPEQQAQQQQYMRKHLEEFQKYQHMLQMREIGVIDKINQLKKELIRTKAKLENKERDLEKKEAWLSSISVKPWDIPSYSHQHSDNLYIVSSDKYFTPINSKKG